MKIPKDKVFKEYSKAIEAKSQTVVAQTGKAKFADYTEKQLSQLPDDIIEHSFGCGNPVAFAKVKTGETVLDLGCGAGLDLLLAADMVGNSGRVIGVDYNEDMLKLAKNRIIDYKNIELRIGKIEDLPVEPNSIDWVISNCVINLSNDKQAAFDEIARVLKPSGKMLVSDIVAEKLPWWITHSGIMRAACAGGVIPEKDYIHGLEQAGLKDIEIVGRQHYAASQLAAIISDAAPAAIQTISCCGKSLLHSFMTLIAKPVARNLWSVKISATSSKV